MSVKLLFQEAMSCIGKLFYTIIRSDDGLIPVWCQAII